MSLHKKNINDHLSFLVDELKNTVSTSGKSGQHNLNISLGSSLGTLTLADSTGDVTFDIANDGWAWGNGEAGQKLNLYFYTGTIDDKTLADIEEINFTMVNYSVEKPFIVIYTKPTGNNDHGAFYHSRVYYKPSDDFVVGKTHYEYGNSHLNLSNNPTKPITKWFSEGDALQTEQILYITLQTSSGENVGNYAFTIDHFGYKFKNDDMVSIKLTNEITEPEEHNYVTEDDFEAGLGEIMTSLENGFTAVTEQDATVRNVLITNESIPVSNLYLEASDNTLALMYPVLVSIDTKMTEMINLLQSPL
jgi:hypothetical protein